MPTRADLIKQAEIEEALGAYFVKVTGQQSAFAHECFSRAAALRALAGGEWVEVPRLDREDG